MSGIVSATFAAFAPFVTPCATLALGLAAFAPTVASAQYGPVDPYEAAVRTLKEAIDSPNEGAQHSAMVALRELRDPALQPLLTRLLKSDDWSLRVDSVLGLAELTPSKKVDIELIASLPGEGDRESAINAVVALELLDTPRVEAMLAWDDVPTAQRLLLACELRRLGGTPDVAMLMKLSDSKTPEIAGTATALLLDLHAAEAQSVSARVSSEIAALPARSRSEVVAQIATTCSIGRLTGAAEFLAALITLPDITSDARMRALGSLLVLAPEAAYPVLAAAIEADRSQTSLMRHAAILLASGVRAPKPEWDRLRNGDVLIEALATAGTELGESKDDAAYERILALRHRVALRAALEGARRVGSSADRTLGIGCAKLLATSKREVTPLAESIMQAIARLAIVAPEELRSILEGASDDREIQESILLALLRAGTREAAAVAQSARGKCSRLGEAMIVVLCARHAEKLSQQQLELLATVSGGGTDVAPAVRTQAAWLWLRHSGRTEKAIETLVAANGASSARASSPSSSSASNSGASNVGVAAPRVPASTESTP